MKKVFSPFALSALLLGFSVSAMAQPLTGSFQDSRDGQIYTSVKIGSQIWMAENLNFKTEKSKCFKKSHYGCMYSWADAMALPERCNKESCANLTEGHNNKGICPTGWHIPSYSEWSQLIEGLGGDKVAGKLLKSKDKWENGNGNDSYGFKVLPTAGLNEKQDEGGYGATFWTASELWEPGGTPTPTSAIYVNIGQYMFYENSDHLVVMDDMMYKDNVPGQIRCIKD